MKWLMADTLNAVSLQRYLDWVARAGVVAEVASPGKPFPLDVGGYAALLLAGGHDVNPELYGQEVHPSTVKVVPERDDLEFALTALFLRVGRPIFGVCRGMQVLNVALGGALIQDLPPAILAQHRAQEDVMHDVLVTPGSEWAVRLGVRTAVNSSHHQALDPERLGRGVKVVAKSLDGVIEAVEADASLVWAVQWHPERLPPESPAAKDLLAYWVEKCCR